MADELPPIKSRLILDDSQVAEVMDQVGKTSYTMGRSIAAGAEIGRLGTWSLGEATENLAQSMNMPNQMSRQLGNSVERLMGGMGKLAVGFGIAGLAAMAAYAIWSKVNEEKKKEHENLEKTVDGLLKEEGALYKNRIETQELRAANERLRDVKRGILDQKFGEWIKQETEEIAKLKNELAGGGPWASIWKWIKDVKDIDEMNAEAQVKRTKEVVDQINQKESELRQKQAERKAQRLNEINELNEAEKKKYYDYAEIMRKEGEWIVKNAEEQRRADAMKVQGMQVTAQNFSSTFQMMASLGTKHARQWFTMYKMAAISEATIGALAGFNQVLRDPLIPTWLKPAWAASILAMGMAKVAVIRAQQFQGGGGGGAGGGAVGTFAANPSTGLPAGNGAPVNLVITINGQSTDYGDITSGVLNELYRNNGSMGGFTVAVERSA
jgi:hypothetical protein